MAEKNSYVEVLDDYITKYLSEPDDGSLYAFLSVFFEGVTNNYSLPCPVELNQEKMTVSPAFMSL